MVDEETQDVAARRAGAPVNRDARPDPGVIEGEIAARARDEDGPSPARPRRREAARLNLVRARRRQAGPRLALALSRPARSPA